MSPTNIFAPASTPADSIFGLSIFVQIGVGLVAGLVVARPERIGTRQPAPLAVRMGIEAPGLMEERQEKANR
jgi:hypothetical protein